MNSIVFWKEAIIEKDPLKFGPRLTFSHRFWLLILSYHPRSFYHLWKNILKWVVEKKEKENMKLAFRNII